LELGGGAGHTSEENKRKIYVIEQNVTSGSSKDKRVLLN
jgi:hypothetical protein